VSSALPWLTEKRARMALILGAIAVAGALFLWARWPRPEFPLHEVMFYGDSTAAGARVLIDGVVIGDLVPRRASQVDPPSLDRKVADGPHQLTCISAQGETLRAEYFSTESMEVQVDFERDTVFVMN